MTKSPLGIPEVTSESISNSLRDILLNSLESRHNRNLQKQKKQIFLIIEDLLFVDSLG